MMRQRPLHRQLCKPHHWFQTHTIGILNKAGIEILLTCDCEGAKYA
jgi:hypothetical protein